MCLCIVSVCSNPALGNMKALTKAYPPYVYCMYNTHVFSVYLLLFVGHRTFTGHVFPPQTQSCLIHVMQRSNFFFHSAMNYLKCTLGVKSEYSLSLLDTYIWATSPCGCEETV